MSKYTEALNEIIKYQYPMQDTDKWRNAMWTCKEALEIADRLEQIEPKKPSDEWFLCEFDSAYNIGFVEGYNQALADMRGDNNV